MLILDVATYIKITIMFACAISIGKIDFYRFPTFELPHLRHYAVNFPFKALTHQADYFCGVFRTIGNSRTPIGGFGMLNQHPSVYTVTSVHAGAERMC